EDRHLLRISDALIDSPLYGVDQVVVHLAGPLAVASVEELLAEAGGAAIIHLKHGVAAVCQPLRSRVEAPGVAGPRSTVNIQDHRPLLRLGSDGHGEIANQLQAVTALDRYRLHRRQCVLLQFWPG